MSQIMSIALLIGGIVLTFYGINAADSIGSDVSKFFSGWPTDKATWMVIGGSIMAVAGSLWPLPDRPGAEK